MESSRAARRTIAQTFDELGRKRIGLLAVIPAGFPDLATTSAVLPALEQAGASIIEIGFPFSDPIADGPTIAAAFTQTLTRGLKVGEIFATVAQVRPKLSLPLVAMVT